MKITKADNLTLFTLGKFLIGSVEGPTKKKALWWAKVYMPGAEYTHYFTDRDRAEAKVTALVKDIQEGLVE